ncbi:hypothetical protein [Yersinia intermedia]|uniref:hypothetical protein n=1 Tax=Yersinia intermedia TaxID=631 RepID=UPI0005E012EA|nr:hypothetical protein [Yersinia intermedia]CNI65966.1 Uncharacterised protein [Yersinia intermedia]
MTKIRGDISNPAIAEFIQHLNEPIEIDVLLKNVWEDYGFIASNSNLNIDALDLILIDKIVDIGRSTSKSKMLSCISPKALTK